MSTTGLPRSRRKPERTRSYNILMQQIMEGWPQHCKSLPVVLCPYWQLKDNLAIELSCVTYQGRFYIPSTMCKACLNLLHEGHPGIVKMKLRAQTSVYWIGLNKEIEDHILRCEPCQINSKSQSKRTSHTYGDTKQTMAKTGCNTCSFKVVNGTY